VKYIITFLASIVLPALPGFISGVVSYVAVSLGFSLVVYAGASTAIDTIADYIQANMDGLPLALSQLMALAGFDTYVNVVLTCVVFSFTLNGLMAAKGYKPSWRKPTSL
jgi:CRISPR/Cas system-associated exonuclease Cas4 (RecB family)